MLRGIVISYVAENHSGHAKTLYSATIDLAYHGQMIGIQNHLISWKGYSPIQSRKVILRRLKGGILQQNRTFYSNTKKYSHGIQLHTGTIGAPCFVEANRHFFEIQRFMVAETGLEPATSGL